MKKTAIRIGLGAFTCLFIIMAFNLPPAVPLKLPQSVKNVRNCYELLVYSLNESRTRAESGNFIEALYAVELSKFAFVELKKNLNYSIRSYASWMDILDYIDWISREIKLAENIVNQDIIKHLAVYCEETWKANRGKMDLPEANYNVYVYSVLFKRFLAVSLSCRESGNVKSALYFNELTKQALFELDGTMLHVNMAYQNREEAEEVIDNLRSLFEENDYTLKEIIHKDMADRIVRINLKK